MTLAEFLASMEAQYGRSGTTEDVLNIPMDQAQQYLDLAAQQYGNVGGIDWTPWRTSEWGTDANQAWLERDGVRITPMQTVFQDENGMVTSWAGVDLNRNRGSMGRFRDPTTGKYYHIVGEYDAQGNLVPGSAGVYEYNPHAGNNFFSAIGPAVRTIGGAMLGAYGLSQLAPAAGAASGGSAAGGAAAMTPAEALAAGVAPGPVGGGSMAGVVGGTAAGTAAGVAGGAGMAGTLGSWLSNPAVIGGGLSLVGGALGADAASDAAEAQERAANAAIEEIRRQYDQNRADQMPWLQAGQTSLADLMARMGDLTTPYTQADFQNDPGYQFELAEGQRALDAAARARGLYGSSGALRELLRYSHGLASTRYQDAWNRDLTNRQNTYNMLSGISGTGQVTAGNLGSLGQGTANTVGDLLTQTGNAQAAGRIGAANAWTNAGSQALNAWQQQMLLDRIGSNLYR